MADATVDSEALILWNRWGAPHSQFENTAPPGDGTFSGADSHNVATAAFKPGTVIRVWNDSGGAGIDGWSEFVYLKWVVNADNAFAARLICVPDSTTDPYAVTNDPNDCLVLPSGIAVVCLSAVTTLYYGWGWCGGVVPEAYESDLGGTYITTAAHAVGHMNAHAGETAEAIGFGPCIATTTAVSEPPCGYAMVAGA